MKFYHGSDLELIILKKNSYVTRNFKDACKFGYRKAVLSNSPFVFIYLVDIEEKFLEIDQSRDRAYLTLIPIDVKLENKYSTYQTPYKLTKFKK